MPFTAPYIEFTISGQTYYIKLALGLIVSDGNLKIKTDTAVTPVLVPVK